MWKADFAPSVADPKNSRRERGSRLTRCRQLFEYKEDLIEVPGEQIKGTKDGITQLENHLNWHLALIA